jgi:protein-L-isoaspartate O-methyltransferase
VSGPKHQATNAVIIPPGEGRRIFSPSALAWFVENLEIDEHDTVKSIVGPSILRIKEEH